jgi:anthrone oxygenase-like protein
LEHQARVDTGEESMNEVWAVAMVVSGGLFAGGVMSIAWERVPAWRASQLSDFRIGFTRTLRRVDRLQPALLSICLVSTIGYAVTAAGAARTLAVFAAAGFLLILAVSVAWLVPIQRTLKSGSELPAAAVDGLRSRWLRGHLMRTVVGVALFFLAVVATMV